MRPSLNKLTAERARAMFNYDQQKGAITWRIASGRGVKPGDVAGTFNKSNGCRYVTIDETRYLAHRVAWLMHYGEWPTENVSAKNGDYQDLRIENLCLKTASETARSKTGVKGVRKNRHGKWVAEVTRDYQKIYLGSYDTEEKAISVYKRAAESDDPSSLRPERNVYKIKLTRRKYHLLNSSWDRVNRENGNVIGWDTFGEFADDVEDKIFPYSRVVAVDPDKPVGPDNFRVERLAKYDRSTPEGREAYYKYKNRERRDWRKGHSLNRSFGISLDDYKRMHQEQSGVCAVCGEKESHRYKGDVRSLSVDHCHATGAIRQLLCHSCNHGLGCFRDNPELMRAAAQYIEHHRAKQNSVPASDHPPNHIGARAS